MIEPIYANRKPWFLITSILAFAAVSGFSILFQIQNASLAKEIKILQSQKEDFRNSSEANAKEINFREAALSVKEKLFNMENAQLPWSNIIQKIEETVPELEDGGEPKIIFRSYNGTSDGYISASATTRQDSSTPFSDVASLIKAFSGEPAFKNVFVPSITKSLTPEGATVLSFSINFKYQKPSL